VSPKPQWLNQAPSEIVDVAKKIKQRMKAAAKAIKLIVRQVVDERPDLVLVRLEPCLEGFRGVLMSSSSSSRWFDPSRSPIAPARLFMVTDSYPAMSRCQDCVGSPASEGRGAEGRVDVR